MTTATKKPLSVHASAAKMIRLELKRLWPHTDFKVTSKTYSGGNNVRAHWTDGPTAPEVEKIIDDYQYGHFDGSIDLYEYSNKRPELPQVRFVHSHRDMSEAAQIAIVAYLNRYWGYALELRRSCYGHLEIAPGSNKPRGNGSGWQSHDVNRTFYTTSLVCPTCKTPTLFPDAYCPACGSRLAELDA